MSGTGTLTNYGLVRKIWPDRAIQERLYKASPALGLLPKDDNFAGEVEYVSIGTGTPQGIAYGDDNFGVAKANKKPSTSEKFAVETTAVYATCSISGKHWRRFKKTGNIALLVNPLKRESESLLRTVKNDLSSFIHGNGGGALGRIASTSTLASQTITLDKGADKRRFHKGMKLVASTADGTSGTIMAGTVTVASVGGTQTAPTITIVEATWSGAIPALTTTSYLFRQGATGTGAGGSGVINGFDAWNPEHSGSPAAFLGVTRTNDPDMLAGLSVSATVTSPRQRITDASQVQADTGLTDGDRNYYLMSTRNWKNLYYEMAGAGALVQTKVPASDVGKMKTGVTYEGIEVQGVLGKVTVVADPWMPDNVERLLDMSFWKLRSTGPLLYWDDGASPDSPMLEDSADSRELRLVGDIATECWCPGAQVRVKVA